MGPIGLGVLLCAKAAGPVPSTPPICWTSVWRWRGSAAPIGAGRAHHNAATEAILKEEPGGVDLVFECAGDPLCIDDAQRMLVPGGTLMLVGIPPTDRLIFDIHRCGGRN